jgi:hypothetical protein
LKIVLKKFFSFNKNHIQVKPKKLRSKKMPILSRSLKLKQSTHTLQGVASYATGGMLFDPKAEASMLSAPHFVNVNVQSTTYTAWYDHTNKKIVVRVAATGAEVAGAVDLSAVNFRIFAAY